MNSKGSIKSEIIYRYKLILANHENVLLLIKMKITNTLIAATIFAAAASATRLSTSDAEIDSMEAEGEIP